MKKQVILKRNEEQRILKGHMWVFSNEIASVEGDPKPGDIVELVTQSGKFLGLCFYQPHSLITCRILTSEHEEINFEFFEKRITKALELRRKLYPGSETYRLVHGESDFLPGLIIDKYNEFIAIQALTLGMELRTKLICDVLESIFHPKAIVARNDVQIRALENLPIDKKILRGNHGITIFDDENVKFEIDVLQGQKTGFYLDQRENRKSIHRYAKDCNVLDCFCNEGGFGLHALYAKARSVTAFDISDYAISKTKVNMKLNSMIINVETADAYEKLRSFVSEKKLFDMVILDPPAFTKSKRNVKSAMYGYLSINKLALKIIQPEGYLVTSSCSHHISVDDFLSVIEKASVKAGRYLQLLELRGAAPDHPVIPYMPETKYLKFAIFKVK